MKKSFFLTFLCLLFTSTALFAEETVKHYSGSGHVLTVDPLYSQITIQHEAIPNFIAAGDTVFLVTSKNILNDIHAQDLVDFSIIEIKGEARIEKITKTGEAPFKEEGLPLGQAVQDVLVATGEAAKTVTSPLQPASQIVSGTVDATTGATGSVLEDASPDVKKKF